MIDIIASILAGLAFLSLFALPVLVVYIYHLRSKHDN